ncbi:MAG: BatD family protein [Gammaproteobacteria bacterium]|jgi:hypothetical protein
MSNCLCCQSARRPTRAADWPGALSRILLFVLSACLLSGQALAQDLDAQLDRTQIAEGESVTLRLSTSGDTQGSPDLSPLTRDFDILSQGQSTRVNIINGRSSSTREWRLVLLPRRSGELTIPPLELDGMQSRPLRLSVLPAGAPQASGSGRRQPVMLEIEADPQQPYVQGEVSYRVKILSRVPLREASLNQPHADDAIVERLGEDSRYTTQRNGETYQVIERRYAIFPQHSGTLNIESPVLNAAVPIQDSRRRDLRGRFPGGDPFGDIEKFFGHNPFAGFPGMGDLFEETRPVRIRGRSVTLDVRPQPASSQGPWLPARNLKLSEHWSPDPPVFRVGEPVTRTVELIAEGLTAAQLPELATPVPDGLKVYPDQPQNETRPRGDHLLATRSLKAALVPTRPGRLTLPELQVHWWDTKTQQPRVATLAARTIDVLPAKPGAQGTPASPRPAEPTPSAGTQIAERPTTASPTAAPDDAGVEAIGWQTSYWPWITAGVALGWLVTLVLWLHARSHRTASSGAPPAAARTEPSRPQRLGQSRKRLRDACLSNDPKAARAALLDWAGARWPDNRPRGLSELAGRLAAEPVSTELIRLDRALYGAGAADHWVGRHAWAVLERALGDAPSGSGKSGYEALPDLYPQQG